jgi:hypothetical protein
VKILRYKNKHFTFFSEQSWRTAEASAIYTKKFPRDLNEWSIITFLNVSRARGALKKITPILSGPLALLWWHLAVQSQTHFCGTNHRSYSIIGRQDLIKGRSGGLQHCIAPLRTFSIQRPNRSTKEAT